MAFTFDYDRYHDRIEQSKQRLATCYRFEEPDQVPVDIGVGGSFYCSLVGIDIAEYMQDRELTLDAQIRGQQWAWDNLGDDRTHFGLYLDYGPLAEGLLFGAEIVRPSGTSPWSGHILRDPSDAEKLQVPDPATSPGVQWVYSELEKMREIAKRREIDVPVSGGFGIHPPLSAACALAGPERIYQWMYDCPDAIRRLFDKLLDAFFRCVEYADGIAGRRRTSIGLADDHSAFVSEKMYRELVLPYNRAIYDRYGKEGRSLHADGPNDHLFALYADDLHLTDMDIGGFSDIAAAKRALVGKTVMMGGMNCKDLYRDFETARPVIDRAIAIGAPGGGYIFGVGGEAYAGINPDTLVQAVAYAQRISRKKS
ncbi:MAG: uroporphyrinogen decarboxylase family protein [Armatimonadota bacterium]|jgi:uroporphyrinogen-III decarboxylase